MAEENFINKMFNFTITINVIFFIFSLIMGSTPSGFKTTITIGEFKVNIEINWATFIVSTIVTLALIALTGLNVVGSGLASESVKIIRSAVSYLVIWGYISVFSSYIYGKLNFPTFQLGNLIYLIFTFFYALGILNKFTSMGGGSD
ncbi:MAG: hypothetical protein ACTSO2_13760 [Promethearchaeota archaeon]